MMFKALAKTAKRENTVEEEAQGLSQHTEERRVCKGDCGRGCDENLKKRRGSARRERARRAVTTEL